MKTPTIKQLEQRARFSAMMKAKKKMQPIEQPLNTELIAQLLRQRQIKEEQQRPKDLLSNLIGYSPFKEQNEQPQNIKRVLAEDKETNILNAKNIIF